MKKLFLNGLYNSFRNPSRNDLSFTQNFDIKHQTLTQNFDLECLPRLHDSVILIRNRDKLKHFIFFFNKVVRTNSATHHEETISPRSVQKDPQRFR